MRHAVLPVCVPELSGHGVRQVFNHRVFVSIPRFFLVLGMNFPLMLWLDPFFEGFRIVGKSCYVTTIAVNLAACTPQKIPPGGKEVAHEIFPDR